MKVRITLTGGYESPKLKAACGETVEVPDALGAKLIAHNLAEFVEPVVESAEIAPPRNAAKRTTKPKPKARRSSPPAKEEAE